jgi:hypothetical protein
MLVLATQADSRYKYDYCIVTMMGTLQHHNEPRANKGAAVNKFPGCEQVPRQHEQVSVSKVLRMSIPSAFSMPAIGPLLRPGASARRPLFRHPPPPANCFYFDNTAPSGHPAPFAPPAITETRLADPMHTVHPPFGNIVRLDRE